MEVFPVFISYSRKDIELVSPIRASIEEAVGCKCWMDLKAIESGSKRFTKDIICGINNCKVFLFMLTENSQRSEFALRELDFADKKGKHVVIVNVNDSPLTDEFQFLYGLTDTISRSDNPQWEKLLRDLKRWVGVAVPKPDSDKARRERERLEAERKTKEEQERKAREAAEQARKDEERRTREVAEQAKKEEAERKAKEEAEQEAKRKTFQQSQTFTVKGVSFVMKPVKGGTFQMGSNDSEAFDDEMPVHNVTLTNYYIGETVVTQALWKAVMGYNPSYFEGDNLPVESVRYYDIVNEFLPKLNRMTGKYFRLPTEAEWEYAARGGIHSNGYKYAGDDCIDNVAWYWKNSGDYYLDGTDNDWDWDRIENNNGRTRVIKGKKPNELGLYDMSGNVWEWCQDWYGNYCNGLQTNPQGSSNGLRRVLRGGSWSSYVGYCRVSYRSYFSPDSRYYYLGFRLVLSQ